MTKKTDASLDVYLESPAGEFVEFYAEENRLRVRFGNIGRPCMVLNASFANPDRARKISQQLLDKWPERGYVQGAPSAEIVEGSVADELFTDEPESHPLFEPFFEMNGADEFSEEGVRIGLFRNGLRWHDHFDVERLQDFGVYAGVIVEGDVEVNGVFSQLTDDYPSPILVGGDLRAWSFGHKDSHMRVMGDVRVRNIVYGEYNDGSLVIDGDVYGRAFISNDHDMHAEGEEHIWVCYVDEGKEEQLARLEPELFGPEAQENWEDRSWLDEDVMFRFMLEERDPFRPGMAPELAAEVAQQAG